MEAVADKTRRKEDGKGVRKLSPHQAFLTQYLTSCEDVTFGSDDPSKKLDAQRKYARFSRAAKDILVHAGNDPQRAWEGLEAIAGKMERGNCTWTLDTVARYFTDWLKNPEEYSG